MVRQKIAALRDFNPAYVRFGSSLPIDMSATRAQCPLHLQ